jgi:hypothetical protein
MTQTQTIPETFLGVGYTRDRAGLPLEAVRVPVYISSDSAQFVGEECNRVYF